MTSLTLVIKKTAIDAKSMKKIDVPAKTVLKFENGKLMMPNGTVIRFLKDVELDFTYGKNLLFTCYYWQLGEIVKKITTPS